MVERKLLFSPILPAAAGRFDPRRLLSVGMETRVRRWLPDNVHVVDLRSTPREGAIIAHVRVDAAQYPTHRSLREVVKRKLQIRPAQTWVHLLFRMPPIDVFSVYGEPFLEDVRGGWRSP